MWLSSSLLVRRVLSKLNSLPSPSSLSLSHTPFHLYTRRGPHFPPASTLLPHFSSMAGQDTYQRGGQKRSFNGKTSKYRGGFGQGHDASAILSEAFNNQNDLKHQGASLPQTSLISKQVDPETTKYFTEISNVIAGDDIEFEARLSICGNALEETRGKEFEIATDYIISHTLQTLLEGCSVEHLCGFLSSCSKDFCRIAMDKSGSHVAETALKSLAMHLQDTESHDLIKDTLTEICQEIVVNPVDVMCNCHGSHVLRSLLCLCKGVPLDSSEFHATKTSTVLASRLNLAPPETNIIVSQQGFPDLLKFVVTEMLTAARNNMRTLQVDQYSSLVLQTALKMLAGHEDELLRTIPLLLGCKVEHATEGHLIEKAVVKNLVSLMKETSFSHLMEVILEVSPDSLYDELITKVFKTSIFEMSSHPCGNFVIQALISHARTESHMELIWDELGTKFKELLEMGRSGVVGSLIATSQKLHSREHKCCQALAAAVTLENESSKDVVPRILYIDNYFWCVDKSSWSWPKGAKMNVVGSLILQSIFRLPNEFIQAYITSITSLEADHLLEASKDSRGARVIEAFLSSNASGKLKRKLVIKLRGHFGELAVHPSGSFTVDKCFGVSNVSLREIIVSELLAVQSDLSKTRQGPYLMKKLDVDGYGRRPEQWKTRQASKESAYNDFVAEFGSKEGKSSKKVKVVPEQPKDETKARRMVSASSQFIANPDSTSFSKSSDSKRPSAPTQVSSDKPSKSKRRKKDSVSKS